MSRPPFVGRGHELGSLLERLDRAAQGEGGVSLVAGEPGIGKTRLVSELAERARAAGWQVFFGRTDQSEGMSPYVPFIEAVRDYVRTCPLDDLRTQLGDGAPEVALLIREVRNRLPDLRESPTLSAEHERYRLFESVSDFLLNVARASQPQGLLLILDDLQWADKPSLLLVQHLARKVALAPLLVIGTYRSVELSRASPFSDTLAELSREQLADRVVLRPFLPEETATLVEGLTGTPVSEAIVQEILEQTEGNPFFIQEVVRDLRADGHHFVGLATNLSRRDVPETIRQVIGKRLSRLSGAANEVLRVAAILGDGFAFDVLEAVLSPSFPSLVDPLEEVLIAGLLNEDGERYQFPHALIRQTVIGDLSAPRRARLHLQAGEALERAYGSGTESHLDELAYHFLEAAIAGAQDKAVDYARKAGARALVFLAYERAARLYQRAIEVDQKRGSSDWELQATLLIALGDALRRAGEWHQAMETFHQAWGLARKHGARELLGRAAIGYEEAMLATGLPRPGLESRSVLLQEEALRALDDADSVLRATLLASLARAVYFAGATGRAAQLSDEAVAVARRVGDRRVLAYALQSRCFAIWGPDHTQERLEVASDIVRFATEGGDPELALDGCEWLIRCLFELGDLPAVDRLLAIQAGLADEVRQPRHYFLNTMWKASRAVLCGRFDEAEQAAQLGLALTERTRGRDPRVHYVVVMIALRLEQGRIDDLVGLEVMLPDLEAQHPADHALYAVHAMIYAELGRKDDARRAFEWFAANDFAGIARDWLMIPTLTRLSSVCVFLGDADRAAILSELLRPYAQRYTAEAGCLGATARYLGLLTMTLGDWDKAAAHFEQAIELNKRIGAIPSLAHTHYAYAALLARYRQPADVRKARDHLGTARLLYAGLGMQHDVNRADTLLAILSPSPESPRAVTYPDGLTAREVDVLRRIAAGRNNHEIAAELVLSVRTVERHISNLYAKIEARGRADATAYAMTHGLASPRGNV